MKVEKKIYILDYFTRLVRSRLKYRNNYFLTDIYNFNLLKDKQLFSINQIKFYWLNFLKNLKNDIVHFYLGIPYCKQKCLYCVYYTELYKKNVVDEYTDAIVNLIYFYRELFNIRKFDSLYFGGGTPSILSENQMEKIFSVLFNIVSFKEPCEKTIEANPDSITFDKLRIIKKFGFNRISFGIESFNRKSLEAINRGYQTEDNVLRKIKIALNLGFDVVSGDMIYGLPLDTPEYFVNSIKKLIKLGLKHIKLYALQPNVYILNKYFDGNYNKFLQHIKKFIDVINHDLNLWLRLNGYPVIEKIDYIPSNAEPIHLSLEKVNIGTRYQFNSIVAKGVFGLGHHANSYIYGKVHYHSLPLNINVENNLYKGDLFTIRDEKIYYLYIMLGVNGTVDLDRYKEIFGSDFEIDFKTNLLEITKLKLGYIKNNSFVLNDKIRNNSKWKFIVGLLFQDFEVILNRINQLKWKK